MLYSSHVARFMQLLAQICSFFHLHCMVMHGYTSERTCQFCMRMSIYICVEAGPLTQVTAIRAKLEGGGCAEPWLVSIFSAPQSFLLGPGMALTSRVTVQWSAANFQICQIVLQVSFPHTTTQPDLLSHIAVQ